MKNDHQVLFLVCCAFHDVVGQKQKGLGMADLKMIEIMNVSTIFFFFGEMNVSTIDVFSFYLFIYKFLETLPLDLKERIYFCWVKSKFIYNPQSSIFSKYLKISLHFITDTPI